MKLERFYFRKHHKLITTTEFKRVFSKSKKVFGQYYIFFVRENHLDYPRLGFAISVKKVRKSITRNALKRIVRESFRLNQYHLANFDIVVMANANAADAVVSDLRKSINKHWERIKKS